MHGEEKVIARRKPLRRSWLKRKPKTAAEKKLARAKSDPRKTAKRNLTTIFNKFIRLRDKNEMCISCGVRRGTQAGHYWPVSVCPQNSMRFNEDNVHSQCTTCNTFQEGNRQGYTIGIVRRLGPEVLTRLSLQRSIKSPAWGLVEYWSMIEIYKQKVELLEKP